MVEATGQAEGSTDAFSYPSDPRDGWEPGPPSIRAMAPSLIGGAVVPLAVYYLVRSFVGSDATALAIAGIPAAAWVSSEWIRRRRLDPIGAIVLFGFVAGLAVSASMGGSSFVLKVRDSAFTFLFGIACLGSLVIGRRPAMFYLGRAMSAGDDPGRARIYDELWELPPAQAVFRIITAVWAFGLMTEAAVRVMLAAWLPTGPFLAVSPVNSAVFLGGCFAFTMWFSSYTRRHTESAREAAEQRERDGGGPAGAWWWLLFYMRAGSQRPLKPVPGSPVPGSPVPGSPVPGSSGAGSGSGGSS